MIATVNTVLPCVDSDDARVLSGRHLLPADTTRSRAEQARSLLTRMEAELVNAGMTFRHVVRTWFHLEDILAWYGEFNAVRNAFFKQRGLFGGVVPASTGVGIANAAGAAIVGGFLAVKPLSDRARVIAVPSPLQCPALEYDSAFSRAVEVKVPGRRHLYVSGTASIDERGASLCRGDLDGQIRTSMTVVQAILGSRAMTWRDATQGVAYFVDARDVPRFTAYCRSRRLDGLEVTPAAARICREELLFEIELEAVRVGEPS